MIENFLYILAILGGFIAGVMNTLAGSGSLITLPIFMAMGLPANIANGTNRIGVLAQGFTSVITYWLRGKLKYPYLKWMIIPCFIGSAIGAYIASRLEADVMKKAIAIVMILMIFMILLNPKKWIGNRFGREKKMSLLFFLLFSTIACYGGFIQVGTGVLLLTTLVMYMNFEVVKANAIKNLLNLTINIPAFLVFAFSDQINWKLGFLVAFGQMLGAWAGAKFTIESKNAALWIKRFLILVTVLACLRLFEVI